MTAQNNITITAAGAQRSYRFRPGDVARVGATPNAAQHLAEMKIPSSLYGSCVTISQVGEHGIAFTSSHYLDKEFHLPTDRISETLSLVAANKAFVPA